MGKHIVAIVGRPNVGKSTFFNRCVGARHAIVEDTAGVTRDRIYRETDWSGHDLMFIDTGGVIANAKDEMSGHIYDQVALAVDEADVIVFLVDGKNGICGADEEVANLLRRSKKPIILAVNKIDDPPDEPKAMEFYGLGLGDPVTLSAMRGSGGVGDVLDKILEVLGLDLPVKKKRKNKEYVDDLPEEEEAEEDGPTSIAIVGKPNVGKSSITNVLCGQARTIVGAEPGTTRDAIDTPIKVNGKRLCCCRYGWYSSSK